MKKLLTLILFSALAVLYSGCSKAELDTPEDLEIGTPKYKLCIKADKGTDDPLTKALAVEDRDGKNYLAFLWKTTDVVYVHLGSSDEVIGTLSPKSEGTTVSLEGEITASLNVGDHLVFTYMEETQECDYTGQDGTLENIAQNFDYASSEAYVKSIDGTDIVLDRSLSFSSKQAIVKFILMDKQGNPVYPEKLTLQGFGASEDDVVYQNTENDLRGIVEINIDQTVPHNEVFASVNMAQTASWFSVKGYSGLIGENKYALEYSYRKNTETLFNRGKYYEIKVKLERETDISLNSINFNFSFLGNGAQWTGEGPIFVFFEGVTTGYYLIIHDDDGWQEGDFIDMGGTVPEDLLKNGKLTAVFLETGTQLNSGIPVACVNGKWQFNSSLAYAVEGWKYKSANLQQYTLSFEESGGVETVTLNADIDLKSPENDGILLSPNQDYSISMAGNYLVPAGLAYVSSDGTINEVSGNAGDWINVINNTYACARIIQPEPFLTMIYKPETVLHYYALHTRKFGEDAYYHILDDTGDRLVADSYTGCAYIGRGDWNPVGPGKYVTVNGLDWWTTNLSDDRTNPLPHPWTTAEMTWTTANQWDPDRGHKSLSEATFADNSELPFPYDWVEPGFVYQIIKVCGIQGFVYGEEADLSKFIFLPFADHEDFTYNGLIYPSTTVMMYHYNWHYWAKGYHPDLQYHRKDVLGYDDLHWAYHFASTFFFPCLDIPFQPHYNGYDIQNVGGRMGMPDHAIINKDNNPLYFPARPVKKK